MAIRSKKVVDLDQLGPALHERVVRQGFLRVSELTKAGIPKVQHADAIARLSADGFERTKSGVRVPLRQQLQAVLRERQLIPVAQLGKALKGATQKEAKTEAEAAVRERTGRIAIRGKIEVLVAPSIKTLPREHLSALADAGARSAKALRKSRTLLVDDVREQLLDLLAQTPQVVSPEVVVSELTRHVRPTVGLSYIPDAVRALAAHGVAAVHSALIDAAKAGRIELQPESGLNRLSQAELELCPPGPQGTRLSWARVVGRAQT